MMHTGQRVAVLGAGIAGLVAANELARSGVDVDVYEAGPRIAGLAASHRDGGYTYDTGAHFITNRLAAAVGASADCRPVQRYGEDVWIDGRSIAYPLGLLGVPRYVASAAAERMRRRSEPTNAAEWFAGQFGHRLAEEVAIPLAEAWSGAPASELSPAVGAKLGGLGHTFYLRMAGRVTRRPVSNGYCREKPENASVFHVYPADGVSTLCRRLAERLEGRIRLESPVQRIMVDGNKMVGIRVRDADVPYDGVISTAPANILPRLVEGTEALDDLRALRFRPMVFVNLRFAGRGLLPNVVTWFPDRKRPFFRLTEAPMAMPWLAPEGATLITADIGAEVGDEYWTMSEDQIGERCLEAMTDVIPDARRRYDGCRVVRTPIAYPVFLNSYEQTRQRLARSTGVDGLLSVGRNGEFAHILMEDVYWRTLAKVRAWTRTPETASSRAA